MTHSMSRGSGEEAFHELRRAVDEVLRLGRRLPAVLERRPVLSFDGFGDLLDHVLPRDQDAELRIARTLQLSEDVFSRLRAGQLDPAALPASPLALLARAMGLDWESFATLVERDHARFASEQELVRTRRAGSGPSFLKAYQEAWKRDTMDDASEF